MRARGDVMPAPCGCSATYWLRPVQAQRVAEPNVSRKVLHEARQLWQVSAQIMFATTCRPFALPDNVLSRRSRRSYPHWNRTSYSPHDNSAKRASPWSIAGLQGTGTMTIRSTFSRRLPSVFRSISMRSSFRLIDSIPWWHPNA